MCDNKKIEAAIVLAQMELLKDALKKCLAEAEYTAGSTIIERYMIFNNGSISAYKIAIELAEFAELILKRSAQ